MFSHLLKTSWVHLKKNLSYSLLNILGLSLGIGSIFLIYLFLSHELSFDKHFESSDDIYRVGVEYNFDGKIDRFANAPRPMASTLAQDFPQVAAQTRLVGVNGLFTHSALFKIEDNFVRSAEVFYADSTYFQVFEHEFIAGIANKALSRPNSLVVTEEMATRLFGTTDVLGKRVKMDNQLDLEITGVFKAVAKPTHMPIEALVSWVHDERPGEMSRWLGWHVYSYVRLSGQADIAELKSQLPSFYEKNMKATFDQFSGSANILIQPLTSIHLESDLQWEAYANGSMTNIYVFSTVAIFILLLITINYTNLASARALQRFKEIGVRKVLGSSRRQVFFQLLADSFLTTFIATLFSGLIVYLLLPYFARITHIDLDSQVLTNASSLIVIFLLFVAISLISGLYPASLISRVRPINSINNRYSGGKGSTVARKVLVTVQFAIASALLFATATVIRQSSYMIDKDLGFDRENTLAVMVRDSNLQSRIESIRNDLLAVPGVTAAASTSSYPGQPLVQGMLDLKELDGSYTSTGLEFMETGLDLPTTLGMKIVSGRTFNKEFSTDMEQSILINEAAAQLFGSNEEALGRKISIGTDSLGQRIEHEVIGVVNDFHTISLHTAIQPIVIFPTQQNNAVLLQTSSVDKASLISTLENYWEGLNATSPLEYTFLNDDFISLHNQEADLQRLLTYFSLLIVLVACLGLLGLVAYATRRKAREITIRKVVGSSSSAIVKLMLKHQLQPILISLVVAVPAAWYLMLEWLNNFAYHTSLQWTQIVWTSLIVVGLALITMFYHVLQAARQNPVKVLRQE